MCLHFRAGRRLGGIGRVFISLNVAFARAPVVVPAEALTWREAAFFGLRRWRIRLEFGLTQCGWLQLGSEINDQAALSLNVVGACRDNGLSFLAE